VIGVALSGVEAQCSGIGMVHQYPKKLRADFLLKPKQKKL